MYQFKNGDRCPCCGQVIEGKNEEWLQLFSQTVHILGLDPLPKQSMGPDGPVDHALGSFAEAILDALSAGPEEAQP